MIVVAPASARTLDHVEADAAAADHGDAVAGRDPRGVEHRAEPGGHAAAGAARSRRAGGRRSRPRSGPPGRTACSASEPIAHERVQRRRSLVQPGGPVGHLPEHARPCARRPSQRDDVAGAAVPAVPARPVERDHHVVADRDAARRRARRPRPRRRPRGRAPSGRSRAVLARGARGGPTRTPPTPRPSPAPRRPGARRPPPPRGAPRRRVVDHDRLHTPEVSPVDTGRRVQLARAAAWPGTSLSTVVGVHRGHAVGPRRDALSVTEPDHELLAEVGTPAVAVQAARPAAGLVERRRPRR